MTPGFPLAWVNFLLLPSSCTQGALGTQGELTAPGASGGWPLRTHAQSEGHWSLHTALLIPRGAGPSPACWCSVLLPPIHAPALHSPLRPHSLTAQTSAVNSLQTPGLSNRREPLRPPWPRGRTSSARGKQGQGQPQALQWPERGEGCHPQRAPRGLPGVTSSLFQQLDRAGIGSHSCFIEQDLAQVQAADLGPELRPV